MTDREQIAQWSCLRRRWRALGLLCAALGGYWLTQLPDPAGVLGVVLCVAAAVAAARGIRECSLWIEIYRGREEGRQ